MRQGSLWLAMGLVFSLAGCAATSPDPSEQLQPLEASQFETRIDQLETNLASQCSRAPAWHQSQLNQQQALNADVREVGSLLRNLRQDVQRLEQREGEPVIIREECQANDILDTKTIVGRNEWIGLPVIGTYLKARVDSGANTSSLSAREISRFERDGENWVRFKLALTEEDVVVDSQRDEWIEAPVERRVRVIQASGDESRPVISLLMTLGPIRENVEFTLTDRTHLDYPVLLGRRFMMDIILIDVAETYRHPRPEYPGGKPADQAQEDELDDQLDNDE
ncbi:RimK/LysX family protein [Vreelandella rituensis]|uniref:ATP-dependent zinc protease n=1 Tax=Vreelandella rituensis TaxID=2282306 RepID=A0A368U508_9GAMM|nr:RimK/LysX family protein [Halomonas rituensis]RCV92105.1 ATP-dependent zinc protease [Halomonas rituensis]